MKEFAVEGLSTHLVIVALAAFAICTAISKYILAKLIQLTAKTNYK